MSFFIGDIFKLARDVPFFDIVSIASHALGMRKEDLIAKHDRALSVEEEEKISRYILERRQGRPVAYITRKREFFSEEFYVDERVLIPRPETELIIEEVFAVMKEKGRDLFIIDMGCGSGAIGITISKKTGCKVLMVDRSPDAAHVAWMNILLHGVQDRARVVCSDLFQGIKEERMFDMVLANLPYVADTEWDTLPIDVRDFEPEIALKGGRDGLDVYRGLIPYLPLYLKKEGVIICEISGEFQAVSLGKDLEKIGLYCSVKKDLSGRERILVGTWKSS